MGPRRKITFPMFGDGIFTQEGEAWRHSRELLRPQFLHRQYDDLEVFRGNVDNLLEAISHAQEGGEVDLQPLFFRLTLDVTTAFLLGESVQSLIEPKAATEESFAASFNTAQDYVAKRFRLQDLYWLIGGKKFQDACDRVHHFADQIIERSLAGTSNKSETDRMGEYVFIQAVAGEMDRTALRSQIINILVAGRDTSACLLSWAIFLLIRFPKVMEKLRSIIATTCSAQSHITRSDLRSMTYLQNILKETLRLYPPVPVNTRTAIVDTILPTGGGPDRIAPVLVPKGASVAYSVYSMHRRPDLYGMDAELFRPERWDDDDLPLHQSSTNAKWGFLPFNGGPRVCLGMDFAMTEVAYTLVRLLQAFPQLGLPKDERVELVGVEKQKITLVLAVAEGCKVHIG
ncbi:hypothetical protein MMC25_002792 [Agyrium rufum]|nr:hypothetical protein [Agyrium rufum]